MNGHDPGDGVCVCVRGGGGGSLHSFIYKGRLHPEVQSLTLLYNIFDREGNPFIYLPKKKAPLLHTYYKGPFKYGNVSFPFPPP